MVSLETPINSYTSLHPSTTHDSQSTPTEFTARKGIPPTGSGISSCIRAQANAIINAIHAFLMPQQAGECLRQDISILVADGNLCAPVILHRGEFFQHIAPSANPFFMIEEASYICMAMHGYTSILQYY